MSDQQEKDEEKFLSRWSRRKIDARRPEAEAKPAGPAEVPKVPETGAPPEGGSAASDEPLPPIEGLRGVESEYRGFLRPGVDESLRRSALKKLFQDPHFNVMDGLDTYIEDYTKADPIPEAMLKALNQAQGLIFDRDHDLDGGQGKSESERAPAGADAGAGPDEARDAQRPPAEPDKTEDGAAAQPGPPHADRT